MPPKTGAKRPRADSDANPTATSAPRAKRQTTLSFARPQSAATSAADESSELEVVETGTPEKKAPKKAAKKKAAPEKEAPKKAPTPKKVFKDALKDIDKTWNALHKKYKPNPKGWSSSGVTADDFSKLMARFLPLARSLASSGHPLLAFLFLLDIADHSYGNLEACMKSSGFGDTDEPFQAMDKCMVELIGLLRDDLQEEEGGEFKVQPATEDVGTEWNEVFKGLGDKRPNKQERGWLARATVNDMKTLFKKRRERREKILEEDGDWVGNALNELSETRTRIEKYGIGEDFFADSIKELAALKGVDAPEYRTPFLRRGPVE